MKNFLLILLLITSFSTYAQVVITGNIRDSETREPLAFANVHISGTQNGTTTNEEGTFTIKYDEALPNGAQIVISFIGYKTDSIKLLRNQNKYHVFLQPDYRSLQEVVVVSGTLKEVSKLNSPIPVEIYTPALFFKNPTPNIFESLSMVNGVQPQLNCNVCNTGDIHINGMEGPYTMVLIDGMPIVSSLATVYGLAGIPNSMVKRIEIVKGPASTLYGSEAVAGLINIITKDATTSPAFKVDAFATTYGEYNFDLATKFKAKKAQSLLGFNYFNFWNKVDINDDNFTDVTLQKRISVFNKWEFNRSFSRQANTAIRYVYEDRWGGELQWTKNHRGSDQIYGESIYTNRVEVIGNYELPINQEKIMLDVSYNFHRQDSYYGTNQYLANQHVTFSQLRWEKSIGKHNLLIGLPFRFIHYDDNTVGTAQFYDSLQKNDPMETFLPGAFIQDELKISKGVTMLTGLRYDHHNIHGNIYSPRVSVKYTPSKNSAIRFSAGNGFRVVNLFTEDHAALTGARQVIIKNELRPEESWNINLNLTTQILHRNGYIGLDGSIFYTYFTNKIVGDFITDPQSIIYDNLQGHAISKGVTLNSELAFTNSLKFILGVTLMDVYQVEDNDVGKEEKIDQLFAPNVSGTYTISYTFNRPNLTIDLTGRLYGPMKLPTLPEFGDTRSDISPWFTLTNIQLTKSFTSGLEIYGGAKNILNFVPENPLLNPETPFAPNFDTTYNYAPVQGIRAFAGIRYTFQ